MARGLVLKSTPADGEADPFAPAGSAEESFSQVSPLQPTGRGGRPVPNTGANEIFEQQARISAAFSDSQEPSVKRYRVGVRVIIAIGGSLGLWTVLLWAVSSVVRHRF